MTRFRSSQRDRRATRSDLKHAGTETQRKAKGRMKNAEYANANRDGPKHSSFFMLHSSFPFLRASVSPCFKAVLAMVAAVVMCLAVAAPAAADQAQEGGS